MEKSEIHQRIVEAIRRCQEVIRDGAPSDVKPLVAMLNAALLLVEDHWPLTVQEQEEIIIGRYAVRVFDGSPHDDLSTCLARLDAMLRPDAPR